MGCHECIRACLDMFLCIQLETFIRRRKVVTWSRPRTKILPAASRGQWLTQHKFSWLLVHLGFFYPESPRLQIPSQYWGIAFGFNPQKRSRVAFSFFRLERTLAFNEGGLFGFIFFLSLFLRF